MESNRVLLREGIYYNAEFSCLVGSVGNIHLTPNEKKLLDIIMDNRGRKDVIIEEIWFQQGMVVSEASYYQLVKMLRRKFVAAGLDPSCLKTIPRYGIVFMADPLADGEKRLDRVPASMRVSAIRQARADNNAAEDRLTANSHLFFKWKIKSSHRLYLAVLTTFLITMMFNFIFSC